MPKGLIVDWSDDAQLFSYLGAVSDDKDPLRHKNYYATVEHAEHMSVHVKGKSPAEILLHARPNEPAAVFQERINVYEPITKSAFLKVMNVLAKIQNGFTVNFTEPDARIPEGEDIETYTLEEFPNWESIFNWLFGPILKEIQSDPNATIGWLPMSKPETDQEFVKPVPHIYSSYETVDYNEGEYFTFLVSETEPIRVGNIFRNDGLKFKIYTKDRLIVATQTGSNGKIKTFSIEEPITYSFGEPPVSFLKGDAVPNSMPIMYESYSAGILPFWNKAIRIDSDLDAQYIGHMYLERVEMEIECDAGCRPNGANGVYEITTKDGDCVTCMKCGGNGFITGRGPKAITTVKRDSLDENTEFPGVTYIDKPTDIVKLAEEKLIKLINAGFESLNMDAVIKGVETAQSGTAKTIDRGDLNAFLSKQCRNPFDNVLSNAYKYINLWRYYSVFNGNEQKLADNLPIIIKPSSFDVVTESALQADLAAATQAGMSDETKEALELDLIDKKFETDTDKRKILKAMRKLDPIPNKSESDKLIILNSGGTTKEMYVISSNIKPFVIRAVEEDTMFLDKTHAEKMEILKGYAAEFINPRIELTDDNGSTEENIEG